MNSTRLKMMTAMMKKQLELPYDAQVEYLETDGSAYIDANLTINFLDGNTVKWLSNVGIASLTNVRRFLIAPAEFPNRAFYCEINVYNQFAVGSQVATTLAVNTMYACEMELTVGTSNKITIYANGNTYSIADTSMSVREYATPCGLYLFRIDNTYNGSGQRIGANKIYYNGELVRDFIPVRKGNVGYMYDKVSGQLFGNAGTGDFILGQDIVPVEYLESTGTQYIKTNINGNARIVGCAQSTTEKGSATTLISSSPVGAAGCWYGEALTTTKWGVGGGEGNYSNVLSTTKAIFDINFAETEITGTVNEESIDRTITANRGEWSIFASSTGQFPFVGKVFYINIYQNDTLVRDFIPVRVGQVGYMYDKVSGQLFGNSGTGNFVLGQDIVPVEYLESTGEQYIDTRFIPNDESGFYAHYYRTSSNNNGAVIGCRQSASVDSYWYLRDVSSIRIGWNSTSDVSFTRPCWVEVENNFLNSRKGRVNGVDKISNYPTLASITKYALIFACYNVGSPGFSLPGKIKNIKISQGNQVVHDFIPVRVGTTGYMYDKISNRLFGKSGTGNFLFGEDIKKDYAKRYLTIEPLGSGNVTITIPAEIDSTYMTSISYSKDMVNWTDTAIDNTALTITIPVVNGDNVYLKGNGSRTSNGTQYINITSTANYNVSGNIMSLLLGDNFAGVMSFPASVPYIFNSLFRGSTTLINAKSLILIVASLVGNCYQTMFSGCTSLITAPKLPATVMSGECYRGMFTGCTSLVTAPALPSTSLSSSCYYLMFYGCTSLQNAPVLPATTLVSGCYSFMFSGCTSLTNAPELPAQTLVGTCYTSMFDGCTSLNYVKMLATDISANRCLEGWLNRVASAGTFVKAASMASLPSGVSGIPANWTVEDAS